ncbi:MAG: tRNA pseudouridine(55) synthase TruB [Candidatus Marinimicrobia bacterium]|nr:tRNA pseudouridine(55) synthase TruB [Candidatus Neomarinimicrobiota bacterium]
MILNIHKPIGWTSFDVVKKIRGIVREKKVGHGGTLDPFAEGVLIIGTGKDTKRLTNITAEDKSYTATIQLGQITNTLDTEGEIIETKPIPKLNEKMVEQVLYSFLGTSLQIPPMFSAKKVKGQRLYNLARKNIKIEREPAEIQIKDIHLEKLTETELTFSSTCSKGTYIRVLGKEIAERIGTVGYLTSLIRTQVGGFSIDKSQSINEFEDAWKSSAN